MNKIVWFTIGLLLLSSTVESQKWEEWIQTGTEPEPRSFHSVSSFRVDKKVVLSLIFGGLGESILYNDVWGYTIDFTDAENNVWALLHDGNGTAPDPRYGHQSAIIQTDDDDSTLTFLTFGGYDGTPLQDTWLFTVDATTSSWSELIPTQVPPSRYFHAIVPVILTSLDPNNDQKYSGAGLIGGFNDSYALNDFWVFSTEINEWLLVESSGNTIEPRYGHSAIVYNKDIYVFGGRDETGQYFNDVWLMSLSDLTWEKINDGAEGSPDARYGHGAASASGGFLVFGGLLENGTVTNDLWFFDADSKKWKDLTEDSLTESNQTLPSPRYGSATQGLAEVDISGRDSTLVVFGGQNISPLNDVWYMNIAEGEDDKEIIGPSITGAFMIIGLVGFPMGLSVFYAKQ